jgi:hypothetical protein
LASHNDDVTKRTQLTGQPPIEPRATVVRLTASGAVTAGSGPPELVERVAYAAQLGDLIGELLGAGPFESLEVALPSAGCVVARDASGTMTAAASADGVPDMAMLRRRMAALPERP